MADELSIKEKWQTLETLAGERSGCNITNGRSPLNSPLESWTRPKGHNDWLAYQSTKAGVGVIVW